MSGRLTEHEKLIAAALAAISNGLDLEDDHDPVQERARELAQKANDVLELFQCQGDREVAAYEMLMSLIPTDIDVSLWENLAIGRNVDLPVSQQYGPISPRLNPRDVRPASSSRANAYGKVHSKGDAPSQFFERQGKAVANAARDVAAREADLETAKERLSSLQAGLQSYALTCLLTDLRKAVAPLFAMGPAWTLLRALQGASSTEVRASDRELETQRIMVVLHALRNNTAFQAELKSVVYAVCQRYRDEARVSGKGQGEFEGPGNYDAVLAGLGWYDIWRSKDRNPDEVTS